MSLDTVGVDDFIDLRGSGGVHPNPMFDFLSSYVPRNLKELIRWTEYLVYNSPHIFAALQKLSEYSITNITYNTDNKAELKNHKYLLEDVLDVKRVLKAIARDRSIYGNVFVSVYFPFIRLIPCSACSAKINIEDIEYKFRPNKYIFKWKCTICNNANSTPIEEIEDKKLLDPRKINIIRWDPKAIDIDHNPVTGKSVYYYNIPAKIRNKVRLGNKTYINSMPKEFLLAIKEGKIFQFNDGKLYHLKAEAPAGVDSAWGFPPLTATLKQFFYAAALRKANEAIALDHLVPFRVLHPSQANQQDPMQMLSLARWTDELKRNIKKWRRDPLHLMISPIPLGVTTMGGQGRAMMTLGEVEAAENNIMAAMGIPKEFIYGGLSFTGSSVTLRMLENQLLSQTGDLIRVLQWIGDQCATFLGWRKIDYDLVPFKLIDDVQQKQALISLSESQMISKTTLAEVFGYNLDDERTKRKQEMLDDVRFQIEVEREIDALRESLSEQARSDAQDSSGLNYDQQKIIGYADQIAQQLVTLDEGVKKSQLDMLKAEDFVLYSVVVQRLEDIRRERMNQIKQQMQ